MEIKEEKLKDTHLIQVEGRLDAATSGEFEKAVMARIDEGETRILFDLSALVYVSSAGLRVFLVTAKRLTRQSGKMALCCLQDHVKEVFEISGFTSILSIFPNRDSAVDALK